MSAKVRRGRWVASRRTLPSARLTYREPAPDGEDRPPPRCEETGRYQALRDHWLRIWLRRLAIFAEAGWKSGAPG